MLLQEQLSSVDFKMSLKEPLSLSVLKTGLDEIYREKYGCSLSPRVHEQVQRFAWGAGSMWSQKSQERNGSHLAEELLSFAKSKHYEKKLRVVSQAVPKEVLPAGCTAELKDIKVDGRGGPDDNIYKKNEEIRRMIPRGACLLEWKNSNSADNWISVVIYGHKKFTGGIGDEDEHQPENNDAWRSFFIADPSKATKVVCMEKVNGEAAHIAGRYIGDDFYFIVGSKNVHMIIREQSNIDLYEASRYEYAKIIARTVWDTMSSLKPQKQHLLKALLHHTRCTLVAEIVQPNNQHIVNLSHLKKPELYFISMTSTITDSSVATFTAITPHHFLNLCAALGLHTAKYTEVEGEKGALARKNEVRRKMNLEGEVFYYLDKDENTIGLVKVKTVWYTILRALREKAVYSFSQAAKKKGNWSLEERISSTHKRFLEIQDWLKFTDDYLKKWKDLAENFLRWLHKAIREGKKQPGAIRPTFPVMWKEFLETNKDQTDQIELQLRCS